MLKKIIFVFIILSAFGQFSGQRRSTTVKSYYRKDGTYVKSHTRHYNSGSGSYSYNSYGNSETVDIQPSSLRINSLNNKGFLKTTSNYKSEKISPTNLSIISNSKKDSLNTNENQSIEEGAIIYVSVLRYNDKVLDICPIPRGILGDWKFEKVEHHFNKGSISTEDALDLVSNYGWSIREEKISKYFEYNYSDKGFPKYLTKTIEAIKLN